MSDVAGEAPAAAGEGGSMFGGEADGNEVPGGEPPVDTATNNRRPDPRIGKKQLRLGPAKQMTAQHDAIADALLGEDEDGGKPWVHKGSNEGKQWDKLVNYLNTHELHAMWIPEGDTEPRLTVHSCKTLLLGGWGIPKPGVKASKEKGILALVLEQNKKSIKPSVVSGGGTFYVDGAVPDFDAYLAEMFGTEADDWYIAGEVMDKYRAIFIDYHEHVTAKAATTDKEKAQQEQNEADAAEVLWQATSGRAEPEEGASPKRKRGSSGSPSTPQSGEKDEDGIDTGALNAIIKARAAQEEQKAANTERELVVREQEAAAKLAQAKAAEITASAQAALMKVMMEKFMGTT